MSRHRFRSQPTLQRSGGRRSTAVVGVAALALIAVGAGALIGELIRAPAPAPVASYAAGPIDTPPTVAATPPPSPVQPMPAPPQAAVLEAKLASHGAASRVPGPKSAKAARPSHRAAPQILAAAAARESWADQQQDYERARAAYDANERVAGFQWAQQNRIRIVSYCRVGAQRTSAFVDGCMNYLAARRSGGSLKPRQPLSAPSRDDG
jgi:hypothetical protein